MLPEVCFALGLIPFVHASILAHLNQRKLLKAKAIGLAEHVVVFRKLQALVFDGVCGDNADALGEDAVRDAVVGEQSDHRGEMMVAEDEKDVARLNLAKLPQPVSFTYRELMGELMRVGNDCGRYAPRSQKVVEHVEILVAQALLRGPVGLYEDMPDVIGLRDRQQNGFGPVFSEIAGMILLREQVGMDRLDG